MLNNLLTKNWILPASVILSAIILVIILYIIIKKAKPKVQYIKKDKLVSDCEMAYYKIMLKYFGDNYIILPQVNLASVIDKKGENFRTELFRNVDFGFFDKNYAPILLVEINDRTHLRKDRIKRDEKVAYICKKAKLPLATFWTADGIDEEEIYSQIVKKLPRK